MAEGAREHRLGKWPPERLIAWAGTLGPNVARVAEMTLSGYPSPEMGYRPVLGIIRAGERYGAQRFDAALSVTTIMSEVAATTTRRQRMLIEETIQK